MKEIDGPGRDDGEADFNGNSELKGKDRDSEEVVELRRRLIDEIKIKANIIENLSRISHSIRTPINGVYQYSNFGIKKTGQISDEQLKEYFIKIHACGKQMTQIVEDLQDIIRSLIE